MKRLLSILLAALCAACTTTPPTETAAHPEWSYNAVVYEMNVRQYTPEGTFAAAARELPRLKRMGADIIWLMPIHPIGVKERKGTLGSYYAISDYCAVNPEFGTLDEFDRFVAEAHRLGLRVILDWVANHTSPDARWITERPADWYVRDSLGRTIVQYDWTDIAKLNYDNADMRQEMERAMRFWLERGIDGFRCDMACEVPIDFWRTTLPALRRDYPQIFLLAEGEDPALHEGAFDASYSWELHHLMNDIARGKRGVAELKEYLKKDAANTPREAFRLMFTSNHDENSWAGSEFERMGDAARVMALLTFTLPKGMPLIYTGQEIGLRPPLRLLRERPRAAMVRKRIRGALRGAGPPAPRTPGTGLRRTGCRSTLSGRREPARRRIRLHARHRERRGDRHRQPHGCRAGGRAADRRSAPRILHRTDPQRRQPGRTSRMGMAGAYARKGVIRPETGRRTNARTDFHINFTKQTIP